MSKEKGMFLNGRMDIESFEHLEEINETDIELFEPKWNNKPAYKPPVFTMNNEPILSFQNISCIVAAPGSGKSSVMEAMVSSVINKDSDNLGFETNAKSILFIDFERTYTDVWNSFYRTMKRAKVNEGDTVENIKIISFRNVDTANKRKLKIEELLKNKHYDVLLLDGIGDLVNDTNSLADSSEIKNWVRVITSTYNTSVFTTLHPNKGSNSPRGHLGSEVLRESENVLFIEVDKDGTRTITTDFTHGKTRNGKHVNGSFIWNDEQKMFTTTEYAIKERKVKQAPIDRFEHQDLINLVSITNKVKTTATETIEKITSYLKSNIEYVKTDTVSIKNFLRYLVDTNYLISSKDETNKRVTFYVCNPKN